MFSRCILIILLFGFSLSANSQSRKAVDLKKDYLNSSVLVVNNYPSPLIKWENTNEIQYVFMGELQYMSRRHWDNFIADLESLTGLKINETSQPDLAQIAIHFSDLEEFAALEKTKLPMVDLSHLDNWNTRRYNTQFQLQKTALCLVPDRIANSQRGTYQLQRMFLKALGLLGELENEYSIFHAYQTEGNRYLSKNDKRIIKIHYLPVVKAGMNRIEVEKLLDSTIDLEELVKQKV